MGSSKVLLPIMVILSFTVVGMFIFDAFRSFNPTKANDNLIFLGDNHE